MPNKTYDMTIALQYTDGRKVTIPGVNGGATADCTVTLTRDGDVFTVTLVPLVDGLRLESLECTTDLPFAVSDRDHISFYDNDITTNDRAFLYALSEHRDRKVYQMAVIKDKETRTTVLAGLLTMQRFWGHGRILAEDGCEFVTYTFFFDLEGRALTAGEPYVLERFMVAEGVDNEQEMMEAYVDQVAVLNHAIPTGEVPTGWCSWSCYFSDVDEEKVKRATDGQVNYAGAGKPNLIQIDDGWQIGHTFPGAWIPNEKKFPSGIPAMGRYVEERGMTFGLWTSPVVIEEKSEFYEELKHLAREEVTYLDDVHPFELGDPAYLAHLRETYTRLRHEYGARYFKLDFLLHAVQYVDGTQRQIRFRDGFRMEVLRGALMTIREAVGDDAYLLACGAQMLPCVGICNGSRMSCDIIWGRGMSYWTLMRDCTSTVMRRSYYHRKVFVADADGLLVRDVDVGDGYNATYSEAQLWAISVAMSGGAILSNDELEMLSPGRRALYTRLLPPLDRAAHPVDFFENPIPTSTFIRYDDKTAFLALYNFEDTMRHLEFDLSRIGMNGAFVMDCMTGKPLGRLDKVEVRDVSPHGAAMLLCRLPEETPVFAFSDANAFGGLNVIECNFEGGVPQVKRPVGYEKAAVYVLSPEGTAVGGEIVLTDGGFTLSRV